MTDIATSLLTLTDWHTACRGGADPTALLSAVWIAKTNLDQFATGLVGTRSPYVQPESVLAPGRTSGGSSSGSSVLVGRGDAVFALGTDTAGSGRVPAGFNQIVGLKPTPGRISTSGVLPACRSLDCVSIFVHTVDDALAVLAHAEGADATDNYSRFQPGPAAWDPRRWPCCGNSATRSCRWTSARSTRWRRCCTTAHGSPSATLSSRRC